MKEAMRLTTAQRIPTDRVRLLGEKCGRVGVPKKKGRETSGPKSAEPSGCVHLQVRINCPIWSFVPSDAGRERTFGGPDPVGLSQRQLWAARYFHCGRQGPPRWRLFFSVKTREVI